METSKKSTPTPAMGHGTSDPASTKANSTTSTTSPVTGQTKPVDQAKGEALLMKLVRTRMLPIVQEPDEDKE